jgi:proline iminopeptidase
MAEALYPDTGAYESGWLHVAKGQAIYWEEAGNPDGVPALILHGGPGSGFSASMRQFFDPERYRIIGFDQRNAGRSRPSAAEPDVDLSANTTANLVADIEKLRAFRGVERFVIYGGSWGTTLGLAYAEAHPDRVAAMVLAGVTTTRRREIDWLYRGMAPLLPEEWERFRAGVPVGTPEDGMVAAYNDLMFDPNPAVRDKAARDFHDWDNAAVSVTAQVGRPSDGADPKRMLGRGRIVTHFFRHAAWLEEGVLIAGAGALKGIPGVLVQGRLDLQGPLVTAWELARAWPDAKLVVVDGAGHSTGDGGMSEAIVAALDGFAGS